MLTMGGLQQAAVNATKSQAAVDAFKRAGLTSNQLVAHAGSLIKQHGTAFAETVISTSINLRRFIRPSHLARVDDFGSIHVFAKHAFRSKVRKRGFDIGERVRGVYNWRNQQVYLRPDSKIGDLIHEAMHAYSDLGSGLPPFYSALGSFLYEGATQIYTDIALRDFGWSKLSHHAYHDQQRAAGKLIGDVGFERVACGFFRQDIARLVTALAKRHGMSLLEINRSAVKCGGRTLAEKLGYL